MDIKVGADPEFFVKKDGVPISAHDLVPGTKAEPHRLKKGAIQADGTAVEFNIDPAATADEFVDNITTVLEQIREIIPKEFEFSFSPTIVYPAAYFESLPKTAKDIGCSPDFDGGVITWAPAKLRTPILPPNTVFGGGHVHVGWTDKADVNDPSHLWDCTAVSVTLDELMREALYLWDNDPVRKNTYGINRMRPKPYGVEYRQLSNAWLKYPKLWPWIFESSQFCVNFIAAGLRTMGPRTYYLANDADNIRKRQIERFGKDVPVLPALDN